MAYLQQFLDRMTTGDITRLLLFLPPRRGKSAMTTVRYPVYRLERSSNFRVILGCYSQDLARSFSLQARRIAHARHLLGGSIKTQFEWETATKGSCLATSVGGALPGAVRIC